MVANIVQDGGEGRFEKREATGGSKGSQRVETDLKLKIGV